MTKYSKEQRDRAVDLYIKYERCAADTIRELGYPSRGALWTWYKDRLEEERTGVPSRRGNATGATATGRNRPRWATTSNTANGPAAPCGCRATPRAGNRSWRGSTSSPPANANRGTGPCPRN